MGIKIKQIDGLQAAIDGAGGGSVPVFSYAWKVGDAATATEMEITSGTPILITANIQELTRDLSAAGESTKLSKVVDNNGYVVVQVGGEKAVYQFIQFDVDIAAGRVYFAATYCYPQSLEGNLLTAAVAGDEISFDIYIVPTVPILIDGFYYDSVSTFGDNAQGGWLNKRVYRFYNRTHPDMYLRFQSSFTTPIIDGGDNVTVITGKTSTPSGSLHAVTISNTELEGAGISPSKWVHNQYYNQDKPRIYVNGVLHTGYAGFNGVFGGSLEINCEFDFEIDANDEIQIAFRSSIDWGV